MCVTHKNFVCYEWSTNYSVFFLFGLLGIRSKKIPNQKTVGHADVYGEHEVLVFPVLNVIGLRFKMCFTNAGFQILTHWKT